MVAPDRHVAHRRDVDAGFLRELRLAAILVQARAMAALTGEASQVASNRAAAIELLTALTKKQPTTVDAYSQAAEIHTTTGSRCLAAQPLQAGPAAGPPAGGGASAVCRGAAHSSGR